MRRVVGGVLAAIVISAGVAGSLTRQDQFEHLEHAGLFPTCLGCHDGIPDGVAARNYTVTQAECAECHDGTELETVDWEAPAGVVTNLVFTHPSHIERVAAAGDSALACGQCHQVVGAVERMNVARAPIDACLACHAHEADEHLAASSECSVCHVPLADATELSLTAIAEFPEPTGHEAGDFIFAHASTTEADLERCTVCHVQESCARCHLNATSVPVIAALPTSARVASIQADAPGKWPAPPSHEDASWGLMHGPMAQDSIATCANCHAAPSCTGCHGVGGPALAVGLPQPGPDGPQGVVIADPTPVDHSPGFIVAHGTAASTGLPNCGECHTETYCIDCHEAPSEPSFHPVDFVVRHSAEAYAERTECAQCHSREVFCRDCHTSLGVGVTRSQGNAYHDAQPDWLLAHAQAARQGLEECTTCHQQSSCLRCHSAKSGWRINPHGPDFDPGRVADKSLQSCAICHRASQLGLP